MAPDGEVKIFSLSFFRSPASGYETPACGASQGVYFKDHLPAVIRAFHAAYPGWQLWIHHDERVMDFPYFKALEKMHSGGILKLIPMGEAKTLCGSMLWRMSPLWFEDVDLVACRDIDSLPMDRDYKMLEAFEKSAGTVHALHDSESHSGPLMGGMVAFKGPAFRKLYGEIPLNKLFGDFDLSKHGSDQKALNAVVYHDTVQSLIVHTRRPSFVYPCLRSYPALPQETDLDKVIRHVGAAFDVSKALEVLGKMDYPNQGFIEQCEAEA